MTVQELMIKLSLADPDAEVLVDDGTTEKHEIERAVEVRILEQGKPSVVLLVVGSEVK